MFTGTWFIIYINGKDTFEENLADNPLAGLEYNVSLLSVATLCGRPEIPRRF